MQFAERQESPVKSMNLIDSFNKIKLILETKSDSDLFVNLIENLFATKTKRPIFNILKASTKSKPKKKQSSVQIFSLHATKDSIPEIFEQKTTS